MIINTWIGYTKIERLPLFKTTDIDLRSNKGYIPIYIGNSLYIYLFEEDVIRLYKSKGVIMHES